MKMGSFLRPSDDSSVRTMGRPGHSRVGRRLACVPVLFAVAFTCIAQDGHPVNGPQGGGTTSQNLAASNAVPQTGNPVKQTRLQKAAAADNDRRKQMSDESTQLLAMAVALKAEVDKTNKDVLSVNVIRKADEIQRLARTVKERIRQGSGSGQVSR